MCSLLSRMYRSIWRYSLGTIRCRSRHLAHYQGDTSLSLMRVLSWTPSGRIYISHILGFCAGVWSWDALTSSLKCKCYQLTLSPPREGHLEAVFRVFAYLGLHHNARVVFEPTYPSVDMDTFIKTD
jgi:hypothetical protein